MFMQKLQKFTQDKTLKKQDELAEIFIELSESDQKESQSNLLKIIASQDENVQFAFVEVLFNARIAQTEEIADWYVIDFIAYPAFGSFKNLCLHPTICAAVAKIIMKYCQVNAANEPELIDEIIQLITQVNNDIGFYGFNENPDSEQAIYDAVLPNVCDDK
jgi:5,10-methylenetetrahydrofolate reductase